MSAGGDRRLRVDRRTTIKWLAATMAAAQAGACGRPGKDLGDEIPPQLEKAAAPGPAGYGVDPDLLHPDLPWPRTMTAAELDTAAALCDLVLPEDARSPAASALGVPDFVDEWISAPYPDQQRDREVIVAGLAGIERESVSRFDESFAGLDHDRRAELFGTLASGAVPPTIPAAFLERLRYIAVGAYYSTEAGSADIGYIGNVPISGPYPGPSAEALAHLERVLERLGLELPARMTRPGG